MLRTDLDLEFGKFRAKLSQAVNEAARAQDRMKAGGADLGDKIFGGAKSLAAFAGVGSVGAAAYAFKSIVAHFDDVAEGAVKLGATTDAYQRVSFAASQLATDIDQVGNAVLKAEKSLGDLDKSGGREALLRLGLDAETFMNLSLDEKILALADAYQKAEGDASRMATMQQVLGRGAAELNVLFAEGRDGLEKMFGDAPVAADELVQSLAAINDHLDAIKPKWQVLAGNALGNIATVADNIIRMIQNPDLGWNEGLEQQAEELAKQQEEVDRRRIARKQLAETAADEKAAAQEKKKTEDEAAKQTERIKRLQEETEKQRIDTLSPSDQWWALSGQIDAVFARMQKSGGLFFEPSIEGLRQWSEKLVERGDLATAETALSMLKEAQSIQAEMDKLNKSIQDDLEKTERAADAEKLAAKRQDLEDQRDALQSAPRKLATIGALGGAVARLTGGDPTAMAEIESARARERKLEEIERHLRELVDQGRKKQPATGESGRFTST